MSVDEEVDERTQFELYYPPFEGAIAAGVGSAMCSYGTSETLPRHFRDTSETLQLLQQPTGAPLDPPARDRGGGGGAGGHGRRVARRGAARSRACSCCRAARRLSS